MKSHRAISLLLALALYSLPAASAGFAILEHSARGLGNAFSGGGAAAGDASTLWFNPAGMIGMDSQMQFSLHRISPTFEFIDQGSVQKIGSASVPLLPEASTTTDGGQDALVPNFYYVTRRGNRLMLGLGVNAPFGLETDYDRGWKGRYQAIESRVIDLNINPAFAYRINDVVSIGAGINANYIEATFSNAIDFAAVCSSFAGTAATDCVGATAGPGANDGLVEHSADDWSLGFNAGVVFRPGSRTRLSIAYRSEIHHDVDGTTRFTLPAMIHPDPIVNAGIRATFADDGVGADVTLPDSLSISGYRRLHRAIGLMADLTWTDWSDIPELRLVFDDPGTAGGPGVEPLDWESTWRIALGLEYDRGPRLSLRTGLARDQSPTPDATSRTARLPDNDRNWVSVGVSYRLSDRLSADLAYAHLFIRDTSILRSGSGGTLLSGFYESGADIFSVQLNYVFD